MADINQIIDKSVVDVLTKANNQIIALGGSIDKLIPSLNNLSEAQKNPTKATKDQTEQKKQLTEQEKAAASINKQIETNTAKINALNTVAGKLLAKKRLELQQATQAQKDEAKAMQGAEGSLVRMRAKLKELTTEYDRAGTRTKAATQEINKLSREIGKAEAATNRHQRGVGGYADQLGALRGPIGSAVNGFMSMGRAMWALVANPIGAVIAALVGTLTALYKIFKSTDAGATAFAGVLKAMGNVVDVVIDRLVSFSKMVFDLITFDFKGFKENAQAAFGGVGDALRDAATAGWEYAQVMDVIKDTEAASLTRAAKLRKEIEELTVASKDRNLGAKEQIRLAELAMQKSKELSEIEVGYSKQKTTAERDNLAAKISNDKLSTQSKQKQLDMWLSIDDKQLQSEREKNKAFGDFYDKNEEEFQALQKMRADDIDKETELVTSTRRLQTSLFTFKKELNDESAAAAKKRDEDEKKRIEDEKKATEQRAKAWADGVWKKAQAIDEEKKLSEMYLSSFAELIDQETKLRDKKLEDDIAASIAAGEKILEEKQKLSDQEKDQRIKNEEDFKQAAIQQGTELGNYLFESKKKQLELEFQAAEGNAEKQAAIKRKIAQADKKQALFNIAVNTAVAISKVIGQTGILGLAAWIPIAALGAVQAAMVLAQKVPEFAKGTNFAPGGPALVAEEGPELIKTPGGRVYLANNPALVNLERGSKVLTNRQTEAVLNDGNIVSELRQTRKAIQRIPQPIFLNGSKIAERRNGYWKEYLSAKHRSN